MVTSDNLNLRKIELDPGKLWKVQEEGLAFVFPKSGGANFASGHFARPLAPGDVLLLNLASNNIIQVPNKEAFAFHFFSMRIEPLHSLFSGKEACQLRRMMDNLKIARFFAASESISQESHRLIEQAPKELNFHHRSYLLRIAAGIVSSELAQAQCLQKGAVQQDAQPSDKFDRLSMDEIINLSAGELAIKFNCSRRHLNRLFHQQFGFSVASLRMEMRLLKAASLLQDSGNKIAIVAEECGFNHLGMFNSLFKKRFGANPSAWRDAPPQQETPKASLQDSSPACPLIEKGLCPWAEKSAAVHPITIMKSAA